MKFTKLKAVLAAALVAVAGLAAGWPYTLQAASVAATVEISGLEAVPYESIEEAVAAINDVGEVDSAKLVLAADVTTSIQFTNDEIGEITVDLAGKSITVESGWGIQSASPLKIVNSGDVLGCVVAGGGADGAVDVGSSLTIENGKFIGDVQATGMIIATGGTFSQDPSTWIDKSKYAVVNNFDGTWTVKLADPPEMEETVVATGEATFWLGGDEVVVASGEKEFALGPKVATVTLPAGLASYTYVVSNLTAGAEVKAKGEGEVGGATYGLPFGAKIAIYAVPTAGYAITGTNPYVIEKVTMETTIDANDLPTAVKVVDADTVVYGTIRTAEKGNPVAGAIAIKDGKYVYVGNADGAAAFVKEGVTKVITHDKGMVMPGCTDGHSHYSAEFGLANIKCGVLFGTNDVTQTVLQKLKAATQVAKDTGKTCLLGFGWDYSKLRMEGGLTLNELDDATPEVSAVLLDSTGHYAYCNSECLKRCGIIDGRGGVLIKEIVGGLLELDENDYPTGYVDERVVGYLMRMGGIVYDELVDNGVARVAIRKTRELLLSTGYTIALDGWSNQLHPSKFYEAASRMDKGDELTLVFPMTYEVEPWQTDADMDKEIAYLASLNKTYRTSHVLPEYLKVFMDGIVEAKTGATLKPYRPDEQHPGGFSYKSFWDTNRLAGITRECNAKGLTMHVHTMGDAAVRDTVSAYIQGGDGTHRNCLVHLRNVSTNKVNDFERMAQNNIACTAGFTWHIANKNDEVMEGYLDKDYIYHAYPMKSFFDAGVKVSSHTDYPANGVSPQDPFGIMEIAVTGLPNPAEGLKPHDTNELITVEQAFQALTLNGAWQLGLENERGSIKVGKWADFVLADKDVFACKKTEIHEAKVVSTWFEGEMVYPMVPGSKRSPWNIGDCVEAYTNGTELVIQGAGTITNLAEVAKDGLTAITITEPTVTGATDGAFEGINGFTLTLPDGWQGELPDEDGNWYGAKGVTLTGGYPLAVKNVTFQQRYPWNGLVDVTCDLTGAGKVTLSATAFTNGVKFVEAETIVGETTVDFGAAGGVTNGVKFVWDAAKDCPEGFNASDVTIEVSAEKMLPGQLWKNGPIWAESNLGVSEVEGHSEYGALYKFDDADAAVKSLLGEEWRLPTQDELKMLDGETSGYCTKTWDSTKKGYTFAGATDGYKDKSIFLPAAGYCGGSVRVYAGEWGEYWSSNAKEFYNNACNLDFDKDIAVMSDADRGYGLSVRAVRDAAPSAPVAAKSAAGALDLTVGDRVAKDVETLVVDPAWGAAETATVKLQNGWTRTYTCASNDLWDTTTLTPGRYGLAFRAGESSVIYKAIFWKLGEGWEVFDGANIEAGATFEAGKTYLVLGTNTVNGTLTVTDGAKFEYGAGAGFVGGEVDLPNRYEQKTVGGDLYQIVEKIKGCEDNPWDVGDGVTAYTNGTTLVIGGSGTMKDFTEADPAPWGACAAKVKSVEIGEDVTGIGAGAFEGCASLTNVTIIAVVPPTAGETMFGNCPDLTEIHVPADAGDAYRTAPGWSDYAALVKELPGCEDRPWTLNEGVTAWIDEALTNLAGVVIDNGLPTATNAISLVALTNAFDRGGYEPAKRPLNALLKVVEGDKTTYVRPVCWIGNDSVSYTNLYAALEAGAGTVVPDFKKKETEVPAEIVEIEKAADGTNYMAVVENVSTNEVAVPVKVGSVEGLVNLATNELKNAKLVVTPKNKVDVDQGIVQGLTNVLFSITGETDATDVTSANFVDFSVFYDEVQTNALESLITIHIPWKVRSYATYSVARWHNDTAEKIPMTPAANDDGEYFEKGTDEIIIHVRNFSDYALGESYNWPGSPSNPWSLGEGVTAVTNGTALVIGGEGTVSTLANADGLVELLSELTVISIVSNGVTGVASDAFLGVGDGEISLTLPDGWQGELPDEDGNWYGAEGVNLTAVPLSVKNVKSQQRYPWNGLVDVSFTLTGPEGETNVVITAYTNGTVMIATFTAAVTIPADGVLATNLVWDAMTAGLAANFTSGDVTIEVALEGGSTGPSAVGLSAMAETPIEYLDWDDVGKKMTNATCSVYEEYTNQTALAEGKTYVVMGDVTNTTAIAVKGTVANPTRLILCDGARLVAKDGVDVASGYALIICGQKAGTGKLEAKRTNYGAGIGGGYNVTGGNVTINGGTVTATGGVGGAGIGGGTNSAGGEVTINGGTVTAMGADPGAGIGGGNTLYLGTVKFGAVFNVVTGETAAVTAPIAQNDYENNHSAKYVHIEMPPAAPAPVAPAISAKSAKFTVDLRTVVKLDAGEVTVSNVTYSATAWGAESAANVTLGWTNETTGAVGELATGLTGEGVTNAVLPKKDGDYRLTHSTDGLKSFVKFTVSGYPLGSEGNPWEIGAGDDAASMKAWKDGNTVFFDPARGTVTKAGLETVTNAMGGADFTAKLIATDGSETNDLVMVLGASGATYDTLADALAADEASYTLFDVGGYFVSYDGGEGAAGTMATDTFIPTVPTNLTANAYEIIGYEFAGWTTNGCDEVAYTNCHEGVDFAAPGETLALKAKWAVDPAGVKPTDYADLTNLIAQATLPVTLTLDADIALQPGDKIAIPAGKDVTFAGEGKFDVTATIPTLWGEVTVGEGFADDSALALFKTHQDAKAYFEDGKVVLRGRGESEDFPWILGEGVEAWVIDGAVLAKPVRGTASVAALASVTNALGAVPGTGELQVVSADGTATNDVKMLLGDNGVAYDTLADVFAADPLPETVRFFEVKGANIEFNAMGGVHTNGREIETNFCIVTYTLPEAPTRTNYTFLGWYDGWTNGAAVVSNGMDLLRYEPHTLYAKWQSTTVPKDEGDETFEGNQDADTTVISGAKQSVGSDLVFPDKLSNGEDGAAVVEIGEAAFTPSVYTNSAIASVTTPLYLTKIGDGAFYQVKTLKTLTITPSRDYRDPKKRASLTIGDSAFASTALESVLIPETVTNIADYAFINCAKLKTIVFAGNEKITCSGAAFERCGYETEGGIRIYMSDDFKRENNDLVDDIIAHNPSVKVMPMVGYSPAVGTLIVGMTPDDNGKVSILVDVKTLVNGTLPDPTTVRLKYAPTVVGLSGDGVALQGLTKQVFDDGMLLFEFTKPNSQSAFFTVVIE